MGIKLIDGFDQYAGQSGQQLLSSLTSAGYTVSSGLAMADSRKVGGYALELQVAAGTAGDSWSSRTNNVKQDLRGVAANAAGRFVAVGNNGVAVGSDDNITWLPVILGVSASMRDIEVAGSTWIAVGAGSTILRSTDGKNFSPKTAPLANMTLTAVATDGAGKWVIVGANGAAPVVFLSLNDGETWSNVLNVGTRALNCVAYGGGVWVAGGAAGAILTSADGAGFTVRDSGTALAVLSVVRTDADHWLLAAGTDVRRSVTQGASWQLLAAAVMPQAIQSLAFADGRVMAVGLSGQIRSTDDEDTWSTPALTGVGTSTLYCVYAVRGARSGWIVVGALNAAQPIANRTAVIYVALAPPTRVSRTFVPIGNVFTVGFAHRSTARGRILSIDGVLDMDWPAAISIGDQVGQAIPARNVWYYYEMTIDKAALTATLHINDTLDMVVPLDAAVAAMLSFVFTWVAENGAVTRIDDVYMVDQDVAGGQALVDRLGPVTIPLRLPDNDATPNQWTGSNPAAPHWSQVGLLPPSDASYIRSATSGAMDLFTSSTALPANAGEPGTPILAVGVIALAKKGDIDNRQLALVIGAAGPTQKSVTDTTLSVVPEYSSAIFEKAPGDVPWTAANTTTVPFGVVVKP